MAVPNARIGHVADQEQGIGLQERKLSLDDASTGTRGLTTRWSRQHERIAREFALRLSASRYAAAGNRVLDL